MENSAERKKVYKKIWREKNKENVTAQEKAYNKSYREQHKEEIKIRNYEDRKANPEKHKGYKLKHRYGITVEQFTAMQIAQNGQCAICKQIEKLVVDHNHKNGKLRKLICRPCNSMIGLAKDDPLVLYSAIEYLNSFTDKVDLIQ